MVAPAEAVTESWIPQPIFVAKKGQTFGKIWKGKIDRSVSVSYIESGVVFSTNSTELCGEKSGRADRSARTSPPQKELIMNPLTKWNPFRELEDIQNRLSSLYGRTPTGGLGEEAMTVSEWTPLVDIVEDDKEYLIKAELPEVKKEDVKVTVDNGVLTITGERKFEKEEKGRKYHRVERGYGSFTRSFALPEGAAGDKISAEFKEGVLKVHLATSGEAKPKSIDVKVD
ncbi:MAG: Hsp20/alpha crystallin family protein [Terrimicrobiaceae bacterium]